MKRYAVVDNEETKQCSVGVGTDVEYYESLGMTEQDVEQGYDGNWYLEGFAPEEPIEHKNEQIRQQRETRFAHEADPLKFDYDEAVARGEISQYEKKELWLAKKDQIRKELPYVETIAE